MCAKRPYLGSDYVLCRSLKKVIDEKVELRNLSELENVENWSVIEDFQVA